MLRKTYLIHCVAQLTLIESAPCNRSFLGRCSRYVPHTHSPNVCTTDIEQTLNPRSGVLFVSKASVDNGNIKSYDLLKQIEPVKKCRTVTKHDMKFNNATPAMEVDPETFVCFFPCFCALAVCPLC